MSTKHEKRTSEMPQSDAFALKNSGLNAFLFAEVGTELNGSRLTVLSVLARLGSDPWALAAEWAKLPNAAMVDCLTRSIVQMPLCPNALAEAHVTSCRLVMLLPGQGGTTQTGTAHSGMTHGGKTRAGKTGTTASRRIAEFKIPEWMPLAIFCVVLGLAVVAGTFAAAPPASAPVAQTIGAGQ
jgi:hypothetical protein